MTDDLSNALKEVRDRLAGIEEQLRLLARIEEKTTTHHSQLIQLFQDRDSDRDRMREMELQIARMRPEQKSMSEWVRLIGTVAFAILGSGLTAYFIAIGGAG